MFFYEGTEWSTSKCAASVIWFCPKQAQRYQRLIQATYARNLQSVVSSALNFSSQIKKAQIKCDSNTTE